MSLKFVAYRDEMPEGKDRKKILELLDSIGDHVYYNRGALADKISEACENCGLYPDDLSIGFRQIKYEDVYIGELLYIQEPRIPNPQGKRNHRGKKYPNSFRRSDWMDELGGRH